MQNMTTMAYKHLQDRLLDRKVANRNPVFGNFFLVRKHTLFLERKVYQEILHFLLFDNQVIFILQAN